MQTIDRDYLALLSDILHNGREKRDRTGTGTLAVWGRMLRYSADPDEFPAFLTKKMFYRGVVEELLWFLRGGTNIKDLVDVGVNIWVGDAHKKHLRFAPPGTEVRSEEEFRRRIKEDAHFAERWGDLGPVYGAKWRNFGGVDQIKERINDLRMNPDSRRMVVTAWDPPAVPHMTLPPCHYTWQLQTETILEGEKGHGSFERRVNMVFNMRSLDVFLGAPYDILSYATLLNLIAVEVGMLPGSVVMFSADTHLYSNHLEYAREQVSRLPSVDGMSYPKLRITPGKSIFGTGDSAYTSADVTLEGYVALPNWKDVPLST